MFPLTLSLVGRFVAIAGIQCAVMLFIRRCVPAGPAFWPCLTAMALLSALGVCLPAPFPTVVSGLALVLEPVCLILPFYPRARESIFCFFLIFYPFTLLLILCQAAYYLAGFGSPFLLENWAALPGVLLRLAPVAAGLWLAGWLPLRFDGWRRAPAWVPLGLLAADRVSGLFSLGMELRGLIPGDSLSPDALLLLGCFSLVMLVLAAAAGLLAWQDRQGSRLQIRQLEQQRRMQLEYYQGLSQTLQEFRLLRHDMRHYLNLLPAAGAPQELRERMRATLDAAGQVELCGDPYLNAVLFEKMRLARDRQVRLEARVALSGPAPVAGTALVCAASNLLENALEAARPGEQVTLTAACRAGMLVMEVYNPLHPGDRFPPRPGFSGKKAAGLHGLGLTSVRRALEEAGGSLTLESRDGLAVARAVLPLEETPAGR